MATKKQKAPNRASSAPRPAAGKSTPAERRAAKDKKREANRQTYKKEKKAAKTATAAVMADAMNTARDAVKGFAPPTLDPPANKIGRPWEYPRMEWTDELGAALFTLIATGHSMDSIAKIDGMPRVAQMLFWLADKAHPFSDVFARGKQMLVPYYEELAQRLASEVNEQTIVTKRQALTKDGDVVTLTERKRVDNVARSALAIQTLQWSLSHLKPKKHGRNATGDGDGKNAQLEGLFAALQAGPK